VLSKRNRLTSKHFSGPLKRATTLHGSLLSIRVVKGQDTKISCVISKKVAPKAVTRNLLKRRSMASVRDFLKKTPSFPYIVALFIKKPAILATFKELDTEIKALLGSL
jgi:ribonuclease P protein component